MYIPFSYFGNNCTGSGYGFTFWNNDPTTTDAVSWTNLCNGQAQNANILPSSSFAVATTTAGVSGLAANTLRVDAIWNVTGSLNNVVKKNYTISSANGLQNFAYYGRYPNDTYGLIWSYTSEVNNVDSYIVPILLTKQGNQSILNQFTDNGYVSGSEKTADFVGKDRLNIYTIDLLVSGSNFRGLGPDGKYFLYGTAPSSSVTLRVISSTVPIPVTGSVSNRIFAMQSNKANLIESRSCYDYELQGSIGRTGSYLDCNNQSASITFDGTLQHVCAKANSIQFENAVGADYTINGIGYGSC